MIFILKSIFKKLIIVALIIGILTGGLVGLEVFSSLPEINDESFYYQLADPNEEDGILILEKEDYFTSLDDLSPYILDALIAIEDQRFFKHNGVDPIRIMGAVLANVQSGFGTEGGSTITQQLVKITWLDQSEKTLKRKLVEAVTAMRIEKRYDKKEILYVYLNKVYYGKAGYGIKTASEYYFDKDVSLLGLEESAIITGIIQNPTLHSPVNRKESMINRAKTVLFRMLEQEKISAEEETIAKNNLDSVNYINVRE